MGRGPAWLARAPLTPLLLAAMLALALSMILAVGMGAAPVPVGTVWRIGLHNIASDLVVPDWQAGFGRIVWDIRFPRVILGALVGAGLAVVGAVLQSVTRNPLADPYLFGVSAGAALGAVTVIVHLGALLGLYTLPLAAFAGASLALFLVVAVARRAGGGMPVDRMILAGLAVSFVLMAITNFVIFSGDQRATHSVVFWMLGGLGLARWSQLWIPVLAVGLGVLYLTLQARALNALMIGEETAATLGVEVDRLRQRVFIAAALITGVLVALSGSIGFVGLMVPHVVRAFVGADNRRVLPVAALVGAIFLVWVDVLSRVALAPEEIPIGIITAAIGGTFFIALLCQRR